MKTVTTGALMIALLCLSIANSQAAGYGYTNIIPPGWNQVGGLQSISDRGLVAGFGCKDPGMCALGPAPGPVNPAYGFTYKDGIYTETTPPGWHHGTVVAVNSNGVVIGKGCKDSGGCLSDSGPAMTYYLSPNAFAYSNGTYTEILPPGSTSANVVAINGTGMVIGSYDNGKAFLYSNGTYTNIIPPGWNQVGGLQSISDRGLVAGFGCKDPGMCALGPAPGPVNPAYGFTYKDGIYTETTPPGWHHGTVVAVNSNGVVIGKGCKDSGGCLSDSGPAMTYYLSPNAFAYSNGTYTEILPPGSTSANVVAINGTGMVIGSYDNGKAFLYSNGTYTNIIPPGWNQVGGLQSISDRGLVAGFGCKDPGMCALGPAPGPVNPAYGFTYKDGIYTETTPPGWHHGTVVAVNSNGVVIGKGCKDSGGCLSDSGPAMTYYLSPNAFAYSNGTYTEILPPGSTSANVVAINGTGAVVGSDDNGGFLATPGIAINPVIAQGPMSGSPGKVFVEWGDGFTPNSTVTLHFLKLDGTEYPTAQQLIDANGHFQRRFTIPSGRFPGAYTWWATDEPTGTKSNIVSYQITAASGLGSVRGTLHRNSSTGQVLPGATVVCGFRTTTTAANGTFSLHRIPSGDQVLSFSKAGYQPFSVTVHIADSGPVNAGNRWLVQSDLVKPTIAQAGMSGPPGTTFVEWGTGFTPGKTATLHFAKPDGSQYSPTVVDLDSTGHFEITYRTPMSKPAGTYTWWAIDNATKKKSNEVSYDVVEPINTCNAPEKDAALIKFPNPSCRDKWNMAIYYEEIYNGMMKMSQQTINDKINGVLTADSIANSAIEAFSCIQALYGTPQLANKLANKDFYSLFGVGASESLAFESEVIGNPYANVWFGAFGAAGQTFLEDGNPAPVVEYGIKTGATTINNLLATIGVTTLTKRFQEVEIAKEFLLDFYVRASRMELVANDYGLPSDASMLDILKAVADRIGASSPWYWFQGYDINRVVDHVIHNMNAVAIKQAEYSK